MRAHLMVALLSSVCLPMGLACAQPLDAVPPSVAPVQLPGVPRVAPTKVEGKVGKAAKVKGAGGVAKTAPVSGRGSVANVAPARGKGGVANVGEAKASGSRAKVTALLPSLRSGKLTPAPAWEDGLLDADAVLEFADMLSLSGGFGWDRDDELRRAMMMLVVQHAPQRLQAPEQLSREARLWLGEALKRERDTRAVPLLQSVIAQAKRPAKGEDAATFWATESLAGYYQDKGQTDESLAAWQQFLALVPDEGWWTGHAKIRMAQMLSESGRNAEAMQLYRQIARSSDTMHAAGGVILGFSSTLEGNPQTAEVQLLQIEQQIDEPNAKLAVQLLLSWIAYKEHNWGKFLDIAHQFDHQFSTIEDVRVRRLFAPLMIRH